MAGFTYATLTTAIGNYTEVGTSVLTATITDQFIENSEYRILRDLNIDAYRFYDAATLVIGQGTYNSPSGLLLVRAIKITDSSNNMWFLEKRDQPFLDEYTQDKSASANRGAPRYYAMYDEGVSTGHYKIAPPPDAAYGIEVEFMKMPDALTSSNTTTYISKRFPNGFLYACLVEAYGFLKGPMDMLTYYEQRYKQEIDKFALEQIGRRRRGDYTSGAIRIPLNTPSTTDAGLTK